MVYEDNNKQHREGQRQYLKRNGWFAVEGRKGHNHAFKWVWILPGVYKKAYSREEAVKLQEKIDRRQRATV